MHAAKRQTQFGARLGLLRGCLLSGFVLVFARAVQLQVSQHAHLSRLAQAQHTSQVKITAQRGRIVDRHQRPLAVSVEVPSLSANPRLLPNTPATWRNLAKALQLHPAELRALQQRVAKRPFFVWLKRQVEPQVAQQVQALQIPGVQSSLEARRFYPNQQVGAHVLGFAGIDGQGLEGVEKYFDGLLAGTPQAFTAQRDARGQAVITADGMAVPSAAQGHTLTLSLDLPLQHAAQAAIDEACQQSGAQAAMAIILDVPSAQVLAMAVTPAFNPNASDTSAAAARPAALQHRRNRLVTDLFEPGSTLKPYVVAVALDRQAVQPQTLFFGEQGHYKIGRQVINDTASHGWMSLSDIVAKSSNIGMAKIAEALGKQALGSALQQAGLGRRSGIELPGEVAGMLQPPARWSNLETATIAFGQGVALNGVQLAALYRVLAHGGLYKAPRLLQAVQQADGTAVPLPSAAPPEVRLLSAAATQRVVQMLETAVQPHQGTGRLAAVPGYRVAGKTGTAQKALAHGGGYSQEAYLALFAGFLPAQAPRAVIVVALDEPKTSHYGGVVAAPVFARLGLATMQHLGVLATEPLPKALPHALASNALRRPPASVAAPATPNTAASLLQARRLPSFVGLTARQGVELWNQVAASLAPPLAAALPHLKLQGSGHVVQQVPAAGSALASLPASVPLVLTLAAAGL